MLTMSPDKPIPEKGVEIATVTPDGKTVATLRNPSRTQNLTESKEIGDDILDEHKFDPIGFFQAIRESIINLWNS